MDDYEAILDKLNPPLPPDAKLLINKLQKGRILRYKIDIYSVLTVFAAVSIQFMAYLYQWPWYSLPFIIILMRASHLAEHNHTHLPFFKNNVLNEVIGWFMFINCGIPLQSYREQHVNIHHRFLGTHRDWTSPWAYQNTTLPEKPINKIYYFVTFMILSMMECAIIYIRKPRSKSTFRFVLSMLVVGMVMTVLAFYNFSGFIIFYVVPWLITYLYLAIASWKQHVHCDYTSVYTIAINDLNIDSRLLGFNIGYHTAHHWYPTLHWSLLEEFHQRYLSPYISSKYYAQKWFSSWFNRWNLKMKKS